MHYKLAAIDLDDTFIDNSHNFSQRTLEVVKKTIEKGNYIILASGRSYRGLKAHYDILSLDSPLITCGGTIVTDTDGNTLYSSVVPHASAKKVLEFAEERGLHSQVYFGDNFVFNKESEFSRLYERFYGFPGVINPDLLSLPDLSTPKVLLIDTVEKIQAVQKEAEALFPELSIATSKPYYLEFYNPNASKGKALEFLGEYLGIKREEIIAIGDSGIDLSMIQYAGLGVAVENAVPAVKEAADYITFSNEEEGVAHILEKFMLEDNP